MPGGHRLSPGLRVHASARPPRSRRGSRRPGRVATAAPHHGIRTVAVEPENCRTLNAATKAGHLVDVTVDSIVADSLGARRTSPMRQPGGAGRSAPQVGVASIGAPRAAGTVHRAWDGAQPRRPGTLYQRVRCPPEPDAAGRGLRPRRDSAGVRRWRVGDDAAVDQGSPGAALDVVLLDPADRAARGPGGWRLHRLSGSPPAALLSRAAVAPRPPRGGQAARGVVRASLGPVCRPVGPRGSCRTLLLWSAVSIAASQRVECRGLNPVSGSLSRCPPDLVVPACE